MSKVSPSRPEDSQDVGMVIGDSGRMRRIVGLIGYVLLFCSVAAVLVSLFYFFTGLLRLAVVIVAFMMAYMILMGYMASKNLSRDDREMR